MDCIEILVPGETFRLATSQRDVLVEERTFNASSLVIEPVSGAEIVITLPADHAFTIRFLAGGAPKNQTRITWRRIDEDGTIRQRLGEGEIVSAEVQSRDVRFRVVSLPARALRRPIGRLATRTCQHKLFDAGCRLERSSFTEAAVVLDIAAYEVTVNVALAPQWAIGGELTHLASTERSVVVAQREGSSPSETVLTLQARSYNARKNDTVEVSAGCDHEIGTCADKFHNVANFGGFPHLPDKNPFQP